MHADDFGGQYEVRTLDELKTILQARYEGSYNGIWLSDKIHNKALLVLVKDDVSYLHYLPEEKGHPGFHSVGDIVNLNERKDGMTIFRMEDISQEQPIMNNAVVWFADAVAAAEEFFVDPTKLPQAVAWEEL